MSCDVTNPLTWIDPLTAWQCVSSQISQTFLGEFEDATLYVTGSLLSAILGVMQSLSVVWLGMLSYILGLWEMVADLLGPLSAPVFVIFLVITSAALILALDLAKDTPVLDMFV